jgi:CspA family cold shock protein
MTKGKVKCFNGAMGFGYVIPDDGSEELFMHFSQIKMSGLKSLKEGQKVIFQVTRVPEGNEAFDIQVLCERS